MGSSMRPGRPFVVTLLALFLLALVVWYVVLVAKAVLLFAGDILFGGPAPLPSDLRLSPIVLAVAGIVAIMWSFLTSGGLFGGSGWARVSAVLLALFALPMGYPTDLVIAALVVLLLFFPANVRAFFR
ncbi:MAG TPA: hypothetical protein VNL16_14345 [Chloroflexota bacterium]|nr:hypothetical protein [Chloroflexota bacterium]